jgi:uncharacterized protein YdaU (DUF1376 family)
MAEFPALPLWTDAYLSDTHPNLSLEEQGCYVLLLLTAWRRPTKSLPDDDRWICKTLAVDPRVWKRLRKSVLKRFWKLENDEWRQDRLTREADFLRRSAEDRTEIARSSALVRWAKHNENKANGHANAMLPTPTPTIRKRNFNLGEAKKARNGGATKMPTQPDVAADVAEFVAAPDSPEFTAWVAHAKATNKFFYRHLTETLAPTASFTFTSRWPPGYQSNGALP